MVLDNEEQRQNLLSLIRMTSINGLFDQVLPIIQAVIKLKTDIENAEVPGQKPA